jgi:hypothetical protein
LGIGDWGLGPIPNPQSPIPNPHPHYIKNILVFFKFIIKNYKNEIKLKRNGARIL